METMESITCVTIVLMNTTGHQIHDHVKNVPKRCLIQDVLNVDKKELFALNVLVMLL